jgi:hypothetical protein
MIAPRATASEVAEVCALLVAQEKKAAMATGVVDPVCWAVTRWLRNGAVVVEIMTEKLPPPWKPDVMGKPRILIARSGRARPA